MINVTLKLLVNSIYITKSINLQIFTLILNGVRVRCDGRRFSVLSPFIENSILLYKYIFSYYIYILSRPPNYLVPSDALSDRQT